jgi:hypothetical protein
MREIMRAFDACFEPVTWTMNTRTVRLLKHPWSSITQKLSVSMLAKDESRPEFA